MNLLSSGSVVAYAFATPCPPQHFESLWVVERGGLREWLYDPNDYSTLRRTDRLIA